MNSKLSIKDFDAVIFDMDGVLIDSEPLWKIAMEKVFSALGCELSKNDFQKTVGLRIDEVITYWNKDQNLGIQDVSVVETAIIDQMIDLVTESPVPLIGVIDTLKFLKSKKVKIGLATSSPERLMMAVLEGLKIKDYFNIAHSAQFEDFGKPHPAVYLSAAQKLKVGSQKCLVIEDSLNGVISGMSAKMKVVCIPEKTHLKEPRLMVSDYQYEDMLHMLMDIQKG